MSRKRIVRTAEKTYHVVQYSGGAGSCASALRVRERYGTEGLELLFADTLIEDQDLYRFLIESSAKIFEVDVPEDLVTRALALPEPSEDAEEEAERRRKLAEIRKLSQDAIPGLVWIADGRDPWEVFHDRRFLGNARVDPCSEELKRSFLRAWIEQHHVPRNTTAYIGIDWTEEHRFQRARELWKPWVVEAPLCEPPLIAKTAVLGQLEDLGIRVPRLYEMGFPHNNPLAGETEVVTFEGTKPIAELAGRDDLWLMTRRGAWVRSEVRSFGEQPLLEIVLRRNGREKTVRSTPDHRWFRYRSPRANEEVEVRADELCPGDRLVSVYEQYIDVNLSPQGVQHGIVFGDGTRPRYTQTGRERWNPPSWVTLCGEKDAQLLKWFPNNHTRAAKGAGVTVTDLPHHYKNAPPLTESRSYLLGWLAGYVAADGSVGKDGVALLHSANADHIRLVRDICHLVGVRTYAPRHQWRTGIGQDEPSLMWSLPIFDYPKKMLLLDEHRARWEKRESKPPRWEVAEVRESVREEVFCAIVPHTHCFVLEDNILTGNCGGFCVKAGMGHFKHLAQSIPERYAYHERQEQALREHLDKDVGIMRDRRRASMDANNGKAPPVTMEALRLRLIDGGEIDEFDWGGCGCAI